jgi:hypothetical protein
MKPYLPKRGNSISEMLKKTYLDKILSDEQIEDGIAEMKKIRKDVDFILSKLEQLIE